MILAAEFDMRLNIRHTTLLEMIKVRLKQADGIAGTATGFLQGRRQ
jgi:hypothetical protein